MQNRVPRDEESKTPSRISLTHSLHNTSLQKRSRHTTMAIASHRLISSSYSPTVTAISSFPPKSKTLISNPNASPNLQLPKRSRRDVALLSLVALIPSLFRPDAASGFSFGISGPKDWLREQKKKASRFLLAPIDASRESLVAAHRLLTATDSDYTNKEMEEVRRLFRSAARDCVIEDRNSFVAFQANTGVEVCTFRLVVKNASSLLGDKDPVKLEAESILNDLVRSFTSLNGLVNETDFQFATERKKVADSLMDTLSSLDKFEQGIKDCLDA
ncbi:uncharacterized protein LOC103928873 isoform X1 [Pyrus x bretschneideri]|nr:uncharacterized protein LOC103928873 isoform X1 [Pyrus x bretschneideri]XP_009336263.2 uncharacterized protein LOC103928873 isoform X1 [Pyrus x bretschneideri]